MVFRRSGDGSEESGIVVVVTGGGLSIAERHRGEGRRCYHSCLLPGSHSRSHTEGRGDENRWSRRRRRRRINSSRSGLVVVSWSERDKDQKMRGWEDAEGKNKRETGTAEAYIWLCVCGCIYMGIERMKGYRAHTTTITIAIRTRIQDDLGEGEEKDE